MSRNKVETYACVRVRQEPARRRGVHCPARCDSDSRPAGAMRLKAAGLSRCTEAASHSHTVYGERGRCTATSEGEVRMAEEAIVAQAGPYQVELSEGKPYFYCRCGRSKNQPFCDGSHSGTGIEPLRFVVDHTGTFNICGCKQTDDEPFCDGSHLLL